MHLFGFHGQEKSGVFFINQKVKPGDTGPVDYD
jgi:hypothetical protein